MNRKLYYIFMSIAAIIIVGILIAHDFFDMSLPTFTKWIVFGYVVLIAVLRILYKRKHKD